MWYHYGMGFFRDQRQRKIERYSLRIAQLTEAITGIMEPWSDVAAELEQRRMALFFKRQRLLKRQETTWLTHLLHG